MGLFIFWHRHHHLGKIKDVYALKQELAEIVKISEENKEAAQAKARCIYKNRRLFKKIILPNAASCMHQLALLLPIEEALNLMISDDFLKMLLADANPEARLDEIKKQHAHKPEAQQGDTKIDTACKGLIALVRANHEHARYKDVIASKKGAALVKEAVEAAEKEQQQSAPPMIIVHRASTLEPVHTPRLIKPPHTKIPYLQKGANRARIAVSAKTIEQDPNTLETHLGYSNKIFVPPTEDYTTEKEVDAKKDYTTEKEVVNYQPVTETKLNANDSYNNDLPQRQPFFIAEAKLLEQQTTKESRHHESYPKHRRFTLA